MRGKAHILVGFANVLQRSELAAIRVEHLEQTERGLRLTLPQPKVTGLCGDDPPVLWEAGSYFAARGIFKSDFRARTA